MAYMTGYDRQCQQSGCTKRATFEVRAYGNQTHGYYCKPHAERRVKELGAAELKNPEGFR